jgi:hypothetical protein
MMKNLDTLNAEEMREMLKKINDIIESDYSINCGIEQVHLQVELIGNLFVKDGMNEIDFNDFHELKNIISNAKTNYLLDLATQNINQWQQVFTVSQLMDLRSSIKNKRSTIIASY